MEFEPERRCDLIGFRDPRTEEGELLFPERFPAEVVTRDKRAMGELGTAGQFQQRPTPRGGGMFPTDGSCLALPPEPGTVADSIRYWDKAGTKDAGAFTAGVLMHKVKDGRSASHLQARPVARLDREREIKETAQLDGRRIRVAVEQEPGSEAGERRDDDPQPRGLARHR